MKYRQNLNGSINGRATFMADISGAMNDDSLAVDYGKLKILPLRNTVLVPEIPQPITLGRENSVKLVKNALEKHEAIFGVLQNNIDIEDPERKDLYDMGVVCRVLNVFEIPDGQHVALVVGIQRARLEKLSRRKPCMVGSVVPEPEVMPQKNDKEFWAILSSIDEMYQSILDFVGEEETHDVRINMMQYAGSPIGKLRFMMLNSPLNLEEKQRILEIDNLKGQAELFLHDLDLGFQKMRLKADIQSRTHEDISRQQKESFLMQQMRAIQEELGNAAEDSDIDELEKRAASLKWTEDDRKHFEKELKKLERLNQQNPEYSVQYSYLDTLLNLPWGNYSDDEFSIPKAEKILNRDHYGMEKVKERIIEHIAVLKLRKDLKAPILCLYGPPGVGKTSLGKSIAEALGREYARVSLGGLHDESEIRGHRRTYIGSMPGRIMAALAKCGTGNPVFVLDEIDKIGRDFKGDPSTALLEVLDPEQNVKFHDNYIDHDYDLSKILFIATANDLGGISAPLRDRMEIIDVGGYITEEKVEIARRHLIPKSIAEHGLEPEDVDLSRDAIVKIVEFYTRENGVRQLEKKIARLMRKIARIKASGKKMPGKIKAGDIVFFLKEEVYPELYENNDYSGVVTGLAWTQVGGDILFIETSLSPGKGDKLTLTGNLGDVMKESAAISLQYLKAHAEKFNIDREKFEKFDIHVHVPEGAVPKDGPSAGITMTTSMASALSGRKVRQRLAMTGEMTLRGKVLPVGGIREKILAAKRAGITDIMLSSQNKKDIDDINQKYLKGLSFHYVDRVEEVLDFALLNEIADY